MARVRIRPEKAGPVVQEFLDALCGEDILTDYHGVWPIEVNVAIAWVERPGDEPRAVVAGVQLSLPE